MSIVDINRSMLICFVALSETHTFKKSLDFPDLLVRSFLGWVPIGTVPAAKEIVNSTDSRLRKERRPNIVLLGEWEPGTPRGWN